jgi:hypothetical protein
MAILDISNNQLGADGAKIVAEALGENTSLSDLNISRNSLNAEGTNHLAAFLRQNTAMSKLTFCGNGGQGGADGDPVTIESTMTEADFSGKRLGAGGAMLVAAFLPRCPGMAILDISNNQLEADGAKIVASALGGNTALVSLNLANNNLGADGAKLVAEALGENTAMASVNILKNNIGEEQMQNLIKIKKEKGMISLCGLRQDQTEADFSNQGLGAEDAQLIAADIQDNMVLSDLNISNNKMFHRMVKSVDYWSKPGDLMLDLFTAIAFGNAVKVVASRLVMFTCTNFQCSPSRIIGYWQS